MCWAPSAAAVLGGSRQDRRRAPCKVWAAPVHMSGMVALSRLGCSGVRVEGCPLALFETLACSMWLQASGEGVCVLC